MVRENEGEQGCGEGSGRWLAGLMKRKGCGKSVVDTWHHGPTWSLVLRYLVGQNRLKLIHLKNLPKDPVMLTYRILYMIQRQK